MKKILCILACGAATMASSDDQDLIFTYDAPLGSENTPDQCAFSHSGDDRTKLTWSAETSSYMSDKSLGINVTVLDSATQLSLTIRDGVMKDITDADTENAADIPITEHAFVPVSLSRQQGGFAVTEPDFNSRVAENFWTFDLTGDAFKTDTANTVHMAILPTMMVAAEHQNLHNGKQYEAVFVLTCLV